MDKLLSPPQKKIEKTQIINIENDKEVIIIEPTYIKWTIEDYYRQCYSYNFNNLMKWTISLKYMQSTEPTGEIDYLNHLIPIK